MIATTTTSETLARAIPAGSTRNIIEEGTSAQDFVKRVFDKQQAPSDHSQRSAVCKKLMKDMYFTVDIIRMSFHDEQQWTFYAQQQKFPNAFIRIAAQLLYPTVYQGF